ncbi:MAG: hypothetical protein ABSH25_04065 [Syntrophorhabdales bacterium]|jgi:hypothetical protein
MKKTKHPKDMTTEEAIEHLFTPEGVQAIKQHVVKLSEEKRKPKK